MSYYSGQYPPPQSSPPNWNLVIIFLILIVVVGVGIALYFVFKGKQNVKLGGKCSSSNDCIGYSFTNDPSSNIGCCRGVCEKWTQDWAGNWGCRSDQNTGNNTVDIGGDCIGDNQCKGNDQNPGTACCGISGSKKCTARLIGYTGALFPQCPQDCVGKLGGQPGTCNPGGAGSPLGSKCNILTDCQDYGIPTGSACCDVKGGSGKTCQPKVNGWCWNQQPSPATFNGSMYKPGIALGDIKTCKQEYGNNAFWDSGSGYCASCPSGYNRNVLLKIDDPKACSKGITGPFHPAAKLRLGDAFDGNTPIGNNIAYKGKYWKCPPGTSQGLNTGPIDQWNGCFGSCEQIYGSNSHQDGVTGQCYTCKSGILDPFVTPKTCVTIKI